MPPIHPMMVSESPRSVRVARHRVGRSKYSSGNGGSTRPSGIKTSSAISFGPLFSSLLFLGLSCPAHSKAAARNCSSSVLKEVPGCTSVFRHDGPNAWTMMSSHCQVRTPLVLCFHRRVLLGSTCPPWTLNQFHSTLSRYANTWETIALGRVDASRATLTARRRMAWMAFSVMSRFS